MEGDAVMTGAGAIVMRVEGLHLRRGPRAILSGVSLDVGRGELVAVMGPSGSGKTTILRAIAGLETFDAGCITVDGVVLACGGAFSRTFRT